MCKFCNKIKSTKTVTKISRKGNKYSIVEPCEINPSLEDADWKTMGDSSMDWGHYAPFECEMNVDTKEMMFSYNAYSCDSSFETTLKINFCPFCGRKL